MTTNSLLSAAGGALSGGIEAELALGRALWKTHSDENAWNGVSLRTQIIFLRREHLARSLHHELLASPLARMPGVDLQEITTLFFKAIYQNGTDGIYTRYFSTLYTLTQLVTYPSSVVKYRLMSRIRQLSGVLLSASTTRVAYLLTERAATLSNAYSPNGLDRDRVLIPTLQAVPVDLALGRADYVRLAIDVWSAMGAIRPGKKAGHAHLEKELLHQNELMATAFGVPTSIRGFDDLFNGGLILPDSTVVDKKDSDV